MALFGRRQSQDDRLDRLQAMALDTFARHGVTGQLGLDPDDPLNRAILTPDGKQYGFYNLFQKCLAASERDWPRIMGEHVASVVASLADSAPPDFGDPAVVAQLRSRLLPVGFVQSAIDVSYAREFAPGIQEVLALDLPQTVQTLDASMVSPYDLNAMFATARANLRNEGHLEITELAPALLAAKGDSFFSASRMVDPEFTTRMFGSAQRGIVFSIPFRHVILFHEVAGSASIETVQQLIFLTRTTATDDKPGGILSRDLYYRSSTGEIQQITRLEDDGNVGVYVEGAFLDAIND